jgi:hypothetical protein
MLYAQSHTQLESMEQELELLRRAPPSPSDAHPPVAGESNDQRIGERNEKSEQEQMWRVDLNVSGPHEKGPLLDQHGRVSCQVLPAIIGVLMLQCLKPLRPFTILPSNATERARLQTEVFGPGYKLPTMTVDEYLQIERERGNILTGGGSVFTSCSIQRLMMS